MIGDRAGLESVPGRHSGGQPGESQRGAADDSTTLIGSAVINHSNVYTCPHTHTHTHTQFLNTAESIVMNQLHGL